MRRQNEPDTTLAQSTPRDDGNETDFDYEEEDDQNESEELEEQNSRPARRAGEPPGAPNEKKTENSKDLKRERDKFNEFRPCLAEQDYSEIIGPSMPTFDDEWTRADERVIRNGDAEENEFLSRLKNKSNDPIYQDLQILFGTCCRMFVCDPYTLLSPANGLGYMKTANMPDQSRVIWRKSFCIELTRLIVHPLWDGRPDLLRLFLQYSTICRTNDRRKWTIASLKTDEGIRDALETQLQDWPAPYPFRVHALLAHVYREYDEFDIVFALLLHLGNLIREKLKSHDRRQANSKDIEDTQDGLSIRSVSIVDLEYLREAIDTYTHHGFPMIPTVETAFERYQTLKHTSLDPPSDKQFYDWVERSWLQDRRRVECAKGSNGRPEVAQSLTVELSVHGSLEPITYDDMREQDPMGDVQLLDDNDVVMDSEPEVETDEKPADREYAAISEYQEMLDDGGTWDGGQSDNELIFPQSPKDTLEDGAIPEPVPEGNESTEVAEERLPARHLSTNLGRIRFPTPRPVSPLRSTPQTQGEHVLATDNVGDNQSAAPLSEQSAKKTGNAFVLPPLFDHSTYEDDGELWPAGPPTQPRSKRFTGWQGFHRSETE